MIKIDEILETAFNITNQKKIFVPTIAGLPNQEIIEHEQTRFIKDSIKHLNNDLVLTNYNSVNKDGLIFNLELDFKVIKRKDFETIIKLLEEYEQQAKRRS